MTFSVQKVKGYLVKLKSVTLCQMGFDIIHAQKNARADKKYIFTKYVF